MKSFKSRNNAAIKAGQKTRAYYAGVLMAETEINRLAEEYASGMAAMPEDLRRLADLWYDGFKGFRT
jgi:hypothetical protein